MEKRQIRKISESELDKKSLGALGEYEVKASSMGVYVLFKPQSFGLSETERTALFEFGRDNNLRLPGVCIDIVENSYRATASYPIGDYKEEGWFVGMGEEGTAEVNKMERRKRERTLDEKSLKILGDYNAGITWIGVTVMFNLQSSSFSEIEAKALIEFGRDNNLSLSSINIDEPDEFYQASAFYPCEDFAEEDDDEEGQVEEMGEEEKQE